MPCLTPLLYPILLDLPYAQPGKVPFSPQQIAKRALDLASIMPDGYSVFFNNCEHFAVYCCIGVRLSTQVREAGGAAIGIGLLSLAVPLIAPFAAGSLVTGAQVLLASVWVPSWEHLFLFKFQAT